ncbi:SBBP repeat-containing protein [Hymenobacter norwichensis]|uniref:SBBP repeat-containing protein n=1 Tax=Hymenobacter norwichensis TaxID=223903 RepID=UPI00146B059B|nr:SBBP repeat-containing protein [Hymenobacter norwichensis]
MLFLHFGTLAQSAPTWQSARAIGTGSEYSPETAVDAAGNFYEVGTFFGTTTVGGTTLTSQGDRDGYVAKFTPTGILAWVRQLGAAEYEAVNGVAVDATGNVYITGAFSNSLTLGNNLFLTGGAGPRKVFVIRYSPQGTPEWVQQGALITTASSEGNSIGTDANGNVYVTGLLGRTLTIGSTTIALTGTNPGSGTGAFLARFSSSTGVLQSLLPAFTYSSTTNTITYTDPKLAVAATGEVYLFNTIFQSIVFGSTILTTRGQTDVVAAKYNAQGTFMWARQFGGTSTDWLGNGAVDAAGNLYVAGEFVGPATFGTTTLPGYGSSDGFLVKCSAQGVVEWTQPSGGLGSDRHAAVKVDVAGNPYVIGGFNNTAQLGPITLTSAGGYDAVVATYTPQGQLRWGQTAGGPGTDSGFSLGLDAVGNVYALGTFDSPCSFGSLTLTSPLISERFLARLGNGTLATQARQAISVGLYPNPATTTVHLPNVPVGSRVQLLDAVGRIAHTTVVTAGATASLQGLIRGLYAVRATDAQGQQYTGRLIVE